MAVAGAFPALAETGVVLIRHRADWPRYLRSDAKVGRDCCSRIPRYLPYVATARKFKTLNWPVNKVLGRGSVAGVVVIGCYLCATDARAWHQLGDHTQYIRAMWPSPGAGEGGCGLGWHTSTVAVCVYPVPPSM